jgi:hypothetical protein
MAAAALAVAASFKKERLETPCCISPSVVAREAIERRFSLGMTLHAEPHIYLYDGNYPVHHFDLSMTTLAFDTRVDVRLMRESHEIGKRVDPVPSNLEGRLPVIGPRSGYRLDTTACNSVAVTSDASGNGRDTRLGRSRGDRMAVLTGNLVQAGVDAMAEWDGLDDVSSRRPWAFRKQDYRSAPDDQHEDKREHYAVRVHGKRSKPA